MTSKNRYGSMKDKRTTYQILLLGYVGVIVMLIILSLP